MMGIYTPRERRDIVRFFVVTCTSSVGLALLISELSRRLFQFI